MNTLQQLEADQVKRLVADRPVPPFQPGDTVRVSLRVVEGERERMIAVFSYYERPGVMFTEEERIGFYGRAA